MSDFWTRVTRGPYEPGLARLVPPPAAEAPAAPAEAPAERDIDAIERIGIARYGRLWVGKAALDMGEHHQSVRRWLAGPGTPPPDAVWRLRLAAQRHAARVLRAVGDYTHEE